MGREIHVVVKDGVTWYREWSTVVDKYTTTPTPHLAAFKELLLKDALDRYQKDFEREFPRRIDRAVERGTSSHITTRSTVKWDDEWSEEAQKADQWSHDKLRTYLREHGFTVLPNEDTYVLLEAVKIHIDTSTKRREVRTNGSSKCACGNQLPLHLFEVMRKVDKPYEHHCTCGRVWVEVDGRLVVKKERA